MDKLITTEAVDYNGMKTVNNLFSSNGLEKTASAGLQPEVLEFIRGINKLDNHIYLLVHAVSGGEHWGANKKGDYFPENELKVSNPNKGFKSFYNSNVFAHHANKDSNKGFGKVILAHWNDIMKRVELILDIDKGLALKNGQESWIHKLESDDPIAVSMGCNVPYDICSICGNKAKTVREYCEHVSHTNPLPGHGLGKILPDGRRCYVVNIDPRFFDLSLVFRGAEPQALSLMKLASFGDFTTYDDELYKKSSDKVANEKKIADILKRIDPDSVNGRILKTLKKMSEPSVYDILKR